ncbi:hypothetical protein [Caballeronia sp. ATUFL_M2_KS44]|uniref:hypothetical protein n=1 Tax=Caballeronia sp. ATUFL_M2_KS44 TaxID=2921767 RepID=UPI002027B3B8|nr:hypothetical protein [Caballeronia sp. ATUFL_M2_KS44]
MSDFALHDGKTKPAILLAGLTVLKDGQALINAHFSDIEDINESPSILVPWTPAGPGKPVLVEKGVTSQDLAPDGCGETLALAFDGTLYTLREDRVLTQKALPEEIEPNPLHWMFAIRTVQSNVYAVGITRSVYRRDANGVWDAYDTGIAGSGTEEDLARGMLDIDGQAENDLTAVGLAGEIWHCENDIWRQAESPTSERLNAVRYIGGDTVVVCGSRGLVLKGYGDLWEVIQTPSGIEDFWSVESFDGRVFTACSGGVYELIGGTLSPVDMGLGRRPTSGYLCAGGGLLWSVGNTDVAVFDGNRWRDVPTPYRRLP